MERHRGVHHIQRATLTSWQLCDGRAKTKEASSDPAMTMFRLAFLGSLRGAFFGAIKAALCAYILFLTDTAFVNSGPESDGHVGGTASYGTTDSTGNVEAG